MSDIIKSFTRAFIVQDRWMLYLEGLGNTVIIAGVAVLIGLVIGVLFAMIN